MARDVTATALPFVTRAEMAAPTSEEAEAEAPNASVTVSVATQDVAGGTARSSVMAARGAASVGGIGGGAPPAAPAATAATVQA